MLVKVESRNQALKQYFSTCSCRYLYGSESARGFICIHQCQGHDANSLISSFRCACLPNKVPEGEECVSLIGTSSIFLDSTACGGVQSPDRTGLWSGTAIRLECSKQGLDRDRWIQFDELICELNFDLLYTSKW